MKKLLIALTFTQLCVLQIFAQESSVKILLNDEERFRFDSIRLSFINPYSCVYIGDSAGAIGPNSAYNVAIGKLAGFYDTTGTNNTYIGFKSGWKCDSAYSNTFVGSWSGRMNTSGSINTFIGRRAGHINTTGSENTFLGQASGFANTTGSYNTYIGRLSGCYNQTGDSNIFIGYFAGTGDNSSNRLVIANSDTPEPLIYGEFDNKMLRFNAIRMEMRNALENIIVGDSSGTQVYGNHNVIIGNRAGKYIKGGNQNTFIGTQAGYSDTTGYDNVFVGMQSGYSNTTGYRNTFVGISSGATNTTGMRNTFVGLSSGAANTTGSYNTCIGRIAGYTNETGDSNVFIGNGAGRYEMGSAKLYIANSDNAEPLIYGDFAEQKLKFYADSVQVTGMIHSSGEVRTDQQFNASGNPGITDTVNSITDIDFSQQKFRYQTTVYSGGIATFKSLESGWVDTIIENLVPCGKIGLVGEFNNWTDDVFLAWNTYKDLWTVSVKFTIADDHSYPVDSIVEVKFREYAGWDVNWGSTEFPDGTGYQGGENIPVTLSDSEDTTLYFINFNCRTGAYSFTDLTGYCGDSLTDSRDGRKYATVLIGNQCWMAENLNTSKYRNDDIMPNVSDGTTWSNLTSGAYCWYNNDSATYENIYGKLYNWFALADIRGLCPTGWHGPTDSEWTTMTDYLGGLSVAGGKLKEAGTTHWQSPNTGATNESGFTALPGGGRRDNGSFDLIDQEGYWWSATEGDALGAYDYSMHFNDSQVSFYNYHKSGGDAVRCLKDN